MHETDQPLWNRLYSFSLENLFASFFLMLIISFLGLTFNIANNNYITTENLTNEVYSSFFMFVVLATALFISFHLVNGLKQYFEN